MKITKSHNQAALEIKDSYLFQHRVNEVGVKGTEVFTLFDKMRPDKQDWIIQMLQLNPFEKPVLTLSYPEGQYIINTSQRFVKITPTKHESVYYEEFECFIGYERLRYEKKRKRKSAGTAAFIELGLVKKTGAILFWKIPLDNTGYFFWNVTRLTETIRTI